MAALIAVLLFLMFGSTLLLTTGLHQAALSTGIFVTLFLWGVICLMTLDRTRPSEEGSPGRKGKKN